MSAYELRFLLFRKLIYSSEVTSPKVAKQIYGMMGELYLLAIFEISKRKFLEEFYLIEARMSAKFDWENSKIKTQDRSLQNHFVGQRRTAKYSVPAMAEYKIHYLIIKHLPQPAREVLATIDYTDTVGIAQALAQLDLACQEREDVSAINTLNLKVSKNRSNGQGYQNPE